MVTSTTTPDRFEPLECERLGGGLELRHARSFGEKRKGLAGLESLPLEVGLQIHRCRSIHTVGMRFALDLLWLDGDGQVLRIDRAVGPRRLRGNRRAKSVVEVAAGSGDEWAEALAAR